MYIPSKKKDRQKITYMGFLGVSFLIAAAWFLRLKKYSFALLSFAFGVAGTLGALGELGYTIHQIVSVCFVIFSFFYHIVGYFLPRKFKNHWINF